MKEGHVAVDAAVGPSDIFFSSLFFFSLKYKVVHSFSCRDIFELVTDNTGDEFLIRTFCVLAKKQVKKCQCLEVFLVVVQNPQVLRQ
jgi:hypothetical protein